MAPFSENSYNQGYNDGFNGKYDYFRKEDRAYNAGFKAGYFKSKGIPKNKNKESVQEANRQVEEYKDNSYYANLLFGDVNFTTVKITAILKALLVLVVIAIISFISGNKSFHKENISPNANNTTQQEELNYAPTAQNPKNVLNKQEEVSRDTLTQTDWEPYMRDLQRRIKMNWSPPISGRDKTVEILFKISKDGRLLSYEIQKSSGITEVDIAAVQAIQLTAPFRPLPEGFKGDSIDILFTFDYHKIQ